MEFCEDFAAIQAILNNLQRELGDFTEIIQDPGNDSKIQRVVEGLKNYMINKHYLESNKINLKFEQEIRRMHFFLVLNTKLDNELTYFKNSRFKHLINIIPQLSKWLLTKLVWNLHLFRFHAEVAYSLPVEISVELLDYCNDCIKLDEPYAVLENSAFFAAAIYVKTYYLRHDVISKDQIAGYVTVLLQKFIDLVNNYITPETNQMEVWPPSEIYRYMGTAVLEILKLLKCAFNIFLHDLVSPLNDLYVLKSGDSPSVNKHLSKSVQAMKNLNDCLMSVCEANLEAITLEVFCAWVEYQHNNVQIQRSIGYLADDLLKELHNFDNTGKLSAMLSGIAIKKKTIEEQVEEAVEETLLKNVVIEDKNQPIWIRGFLKHGILNSEKAIEIFKTIIKAFDAEHFMYLLNYYSDDIKSKPDLRDLIIKHISNLFETDLLQITKTYFSKNKFNNIYELPEFDIKMREYFNKLISDTDKVTLQKEAVILLLQSPSKFMQVLFDESIRQTDHMNNILEILKFIRSVCLLPSENNENPFLYEIILQNLREREFSESNEICVIELIKNLYQQDMVSDKVLEELLIIYESSVDSSNFQKATFIAKICQILPTVILQKYDCIDIILRLVSAMGKTRWNFFTYDEEKSTLITQTIQLIKVYKKFICSNFMNEDTLDKALQSLQNKMDCYHAIIKHTPPNDNFLNCASPGYDKNKNHNEQVVRLMKVLPSCISEEWNLIVSYLLVDKDPIEILTLLTNILAILSEIAKKSADSQACMLYCVQQCCFVINDLIYPRINNSMDKQKIFINSMCKLLKRLPNELQKLAEVSLLKLFDIEVMKSMKDNEEFVCNLLSISHLEIYKVICNKIS